MEMQAEEIKRVAIIGAGTMGQGIGQEFARAGYEVTLHRRSAVELDQARPRIRRSLQELAGWGLMAADDIEPALKRIHTTTSFEKAAENADLVVEAVFEELDLKRQIFGDLDRLCPQHTILASNTSSLMPSVLGAATERPDRVLVLHFFSPPHLLPLVEIVGNHSQVLRLWGVLQRGRSQSRGLHGCGLAESCLGRFSADPGGHQESR
jgi:3-hydroxybutyryl-CoA dehydrogenase